MTQSSLARTFSKERSRSGRDINESSGIALGHGYGVLTEDLVKAATGRFDIETVLKFSWCNKALQKISGLSRATSLTELDLTGNNITHMDGLDSLVSLRKLTLAANRIQEVGGLQSLPALEHLLLQANLLTTVASCNLEMLATLPRLRTLYLRNIDGTQANAVCRHRNYKRAILEALPDLSNLDGERNPGRSTFSHQADQIAGSDDVNAAYMPDFGFDSPVPWFKPGEFELPSAEAGLVDVSKAEAVLGDCNARYQELLGEMRQVRLVMARGMG